MDWGKQNRLSRIIKPSTGRTVMLAVDHGYFLGPTRMLEDPKKTITPLIPYADALMPTRGVLRTCVDASWDIPIVLRVSGGSSIIGEDLSNESITTSVKEAIRMNVAAVALSIFVGSKYEKQTLTNLSTLVDECEEYGIPVLAVTAVGKDMVRDSRYLGLACRIAAELGAAYVKTYYCDGFDSVTGNCPVPCVIAGGKKMETEMDVFKMAHAAVQDGAIGVDFGRNIWQNPNAIAMIRCVSEIIHMDITPEQAMEKFEAYKGDLVAK
ncbi:MAG: 3-hydroxy-5-phosphonooxypentane-2,4-dione thiolase [Planctomycetota bacterium]|jgi:putative autoinducer-2 (AI-2) aldolase